MRIVYRVYWIDDAQHWRHTDWDTSNQANQHFAQLCARGHGEAYAVVSWAQVSTDYRVCTDNDSCSCPTCVRKSR